MDKSTKNIIKAVNILLSVLLSFRIWIAAIERIEQINNEEKEYGFNYHDERNS